MRMRTDRNHAVGLNPSVHTEIIGVTQACWWPITAQYVAARSVYASLVKVMSFAALCSWRLWLCSRVRITNPSIIVADMTVKRKDITRERPYVTLWHDCQLCKTYSSYAEIFNLCSASRTITSYQACVIYLWNYAKATHAVIWFKQSCMVHAQGNPQARGITGGTF